MQSEQEILLEHLAKDDDMAYTLLYKQFYVPMVLFASQYINNEEASKDVVQEFFISMLGQKKNFENVTALKVYLYHSVKNRCMNYIQHEQVKGVTRHLYCGNLMMSIFSGIGFWRKMFMRGFWKSCRNCLDNTAT